MSRFKVILVVVLGFGLPSLLMGMDSLFSYDKKFVTNSYQDQKVSKIVLFWKHAVCEGKEEVLPQEVRHKIARDCYDSFFSTWKELPKSLNDESRIIKLGGKTTGMNDFRLITMSQEGKDFFNKMLLALGIDDEGSWKNGYSKSDICRRDIHRIDTIDKRLISEDDYIKIVQLPLSLRIAVGSQCSMYVIEGTGKNYFVKEVKDIALWGLVSATCGYLCQATPAAVMYGAMFALFRYGVRFVNKKPLITLEEQELIKKEKLELVDMHKAIINSVEIERFQQLPLQLSEATQENYLQLKYRV